MRGTGAFDFFIVYGNIVARCKFVEFALVIVLAEMFAFSVEKVCKF